jgi:leucyl-tRNA synthetase
VTKSVGWPYLISDTHGKLDVNNKLLERRQADAVMHAGEPDGRPRQAPGVHRGPRKESLLDEKIKAALAGKTVRKVVVVPGKIVNIVASKAQ